MKISTILIGLLVLSALFLTACQTQSENKSNSDATSVDSQTQNQVTASAPQEVDQITSDAVQIGEMI